MKHALHTNTAAAKQIDLMRRPVYDGLELRQREVRPGSLDFLKVPSLFGEQRVPHFTTPNKGQLK